MPTTLHARTFTTEPDNLTAPGAGLSDDRGAAYQVRAGRLRLAPNPPAILPDRNPCLIRGTTTPTDPVTDLRDGVLSVVAHTDDCDAVLLDARRDLQTGAGVSLACFLSDRAAARFVALTGVTGPTAITSAGLLLLRHDAAPPGGSQTSSTGTGGTGNTGTGTGNSGSGTNLSGTGNAAFGGEPPVLLAHAPIRAATLADAPTVSTNPTTVRRLQITLRAAGPHVSALAHVLDPADDDYPTLIAVLTVRDTARAVADPTIAGGLRAPSGWWGVRALAAHDPNTPSDASDDVQGTRLRSLALARLSPDDLLDDFGNTDGTGNGNTTGNGNGNNNGTTGGGLPDAPATIATIAAYLRRLPPPVWGVVGLPVGASVNTPNDRVATRTTFRALSSSGVPTDLPTDLARGFVRFVGGPARGLWHPIASHDPATGQITLAEPLARAPHLGDRFVVDGWR